MKCPQAIMDGIIAKRHNPTHYGAGVIEMPDRIRKLPENNQWVEVVSVGPRCSDEIRPGDRVLIGQQMGTQFRHEGVDYVFLFGRDPLLVERADG